ncbi:MAG: hypothetical protein R8N24_01300 [Alphaproteobacteria bacterium]|nr:hypothetical protein [Alphaproteobacteria bacterium]
MKKYIVAIMILFIPCVTYALTMCARDNSLVVALNGGIPGDNTQTFNRDEFTWRVNFEYGTILGEATCLSEAEGGKPMLGTGNAGYHPYINTNNQMLSQDIPKGYRGTSPVNTENPELGTQRIYCWCRMTHPAMSRWVFNRETAYCATSCTDYCANYVNTSNGIDQYQRIIMFKTIGR